VEVGDNVARFVRPSLTEEYSVSVDGLRQDFVLAERPAGEGKVRVELAVDGAKAEPLVNGVRLVLADGGRRLNYHQLRVADASGKELPAKMEVLSGKRLAVLLDDTAAEYPVRIDPTFSDANWMSMGGVPGAKGQVLATLVDGADNLYIGGGFTVVGDVTANYVAPVPKARIWRVDEFNSLTRDA